MTSCCTVAATYRMIQALDVWKCELLFRTFAIGPPASELQVVGLAPV